MNETEPRRLTLYAAFAAIYLFWGAAFLAVRYPVAVVPPMLMIGIRCAGGATFLLAWLAWRRELVRPTLAQWKTAAIAGILLFLGSHVSMAWAEQRISSGQAALFGSSIPLWVVGMESVRERTMPSPRVLLGIVLEIVGVGILAEEARSTPARSAIDSSSPSPRFRSSSSCFAAPCSPSARSSGSFASPLRRR
ncbi:MAG: EamA family transporter [bacterium]